MQQTQALAGKCFDLGVALGGGTWQGQPAERRKAGSDALRWGCSGLGKGVGTGQRGYRGKQGSGGNRGSLEGEDCIGEREETLLGLSGNRMVLCLQEHVLWAWHPFGAL